MRPALEVTGAWYTGVTWNAWVMTGVNAPLEQQRITAVGPGPGECVVQVAGCGVGHTDLDFVHHGVQPKHALPLVLGHEISGQVVEAGTGVDAALVGKPVVVPSMLPCGGCELCVAGRRTVCRQQMMPGNDRHGGYASHVVVPARFVCPVPEAVLATHELWELAVVADAVSTPFQAVKRSGLQPGELAVVIGIGGIGLHAVQVAAAVGAKVIALDTNPSRLRQGLVAGAAEALSTSGLKVKEVRTLVRETADAIGAPKHLWKVFECSGTKVGQETAFSLLGFGASLGIIGRTQDNPTVALSRLMTYDAEVRGTWAADPLVYPELLSWIGEGRLRLRPFVERHPLGHINQVFDSVHQGALARRAVLVPENA
jgi:6-hydroxycyclohex-1-ene-1-carbonyl-CoA dehydrogenase